MMDGPLRAGHEQLPPALNLEHVVAFLHTEGAALLCCHVPLSSARFCQPWRPARTCPDLQPAYPDREI